MRYLIIIISALLLSTAGNAQSQHWNLFINKTKLLSASVDTIQEYQLLKASNGFIKFNFPERSKEFNRDVIIMNEQRNTVMEYALKTSCKTASFSIDSLLLKTSGKPFTVYVRDIPADPQKAMLVRVAPAVICKIYWK